MEETYAIRPQDLFDRDAPYTTAELRDRVEERCGAHPGLKWSLLARLTRSHGDELPDLR